MFVTDNTAILSIDTPNKNLIMFFFDYGIGRGEAKEETSGSPDCKQSALLHMDTRNTREAITTLSVIWRLGI